MVRNHLGELEELVLTMVAILQERAYGNVILQEIKDRFDRHLNLSSIHVTLYRLEDKGLLASEMTGATQERGGRRKRVFTITNQGVEVLQTLKEHRQQLWKEVPQFR